VAYPKVCDSDAPGQVQVWSAIEIELILQHLMHSICRRTILWDLEFGDLLFAGVSGGVWGDVRGSSASVDMLLASVLHVHIADAFDNLIRVDL
jgi:hypothetical protein